jgi:hypothetical protein
MKRRSAPRSAALLTWLLVAASCGLSFAQTAPQTAPQAAPQAAPPSGGWGPLPAAGDSVTATFRDRPTPLWEKTLLLPYRIIALPFRGVAYGIGASLIYLDERHVIYQVNRLIAPRQGPFGVLLNFTAGGLPGFGGGVTIVHDEFLSPENRFKFRWQSTVNGSHQISVGLRRGEAPDRQFDFGAGYRLRPNARYFGIGPTSDDARESFYEQELTWVGAMLRPYLSQDIAFEVGALYSAIGARGTDEDSPSLSDEFAGDLPPGYHDRSDGVNVVLGLRHDSTKEVGRPTHGGFHRVSAAFFASTDGTRAAFRTYRGEIERFIPLWHTYRVLAIRSFFSWIEPSGDTAVPFQRLMTNNDPDVLRGYNSFRWRDRGMTALTLEYRWPIWADREPQGLGLDAYLLTDIGQVFGDPDEISLDNLTESYGCGFRVAAYGGFLGRIEFAWSDEETVFRLRSDQMFQFARSAFYHGRDPVPGR